MEKEVDRKTNAILKIIGESREPIGSAEISKKLKDQGIDMSERTVRYHMKAMNEQGLTKGLWKEGRIITKRGMEELENAFVYDKVGFMSSRIETMAYKMDFDIYQNTGKVILNISLFKKDDFARALKGMKDVFLKKLATGEKVLVANAGECVGGIDIPSGFVGFGTLCSINLNGILLKHSIPIESKFGGLLQLENDRPLRFTDLIDYAGSSLDPHEVFVKSRMTSVSEALHGNGKILAGLREIPSVCRDEAEAIIRKIESAGIGRALLIGKAGQAVCGIPVGIERVGVIVPGGLNPVALAVEAGLEVESKALVSLVEFSSLQNIWDI